MRQSVDYCYCVLTEAESPICCCSVTQLRLTLRLCTATFQAPLSFTVSRSLLKLMSIESMMSFNHLIFCHLFSFCPQSFLASVSFPRSWLLESGSRSIGASVSVLPMNIQSLFPLGLTGLISLLSDVK